MTPGLTSRVMAALAGVRDPELDESVTDLGFVADVTTVGSRVEVALRLPTYFCAPNFAWLMVNDAHAAVRNVPGVSEVQVRLVDHFAADEINAGVGGGRGFDATFAGLADGELDDLRLIFRRKALAARQDRLCRTLLAGGATPGELARLRLGDLPTGADTDTYLQRRAELGLAVSPGAPFLVDRTGVPVSPDGATAYLRRLRTIAVSIEGNAGTCRALLATRYHAGQGVGDR
ncbi:MAG TPA: iron-sulfur cluster assembly protein [Acidimicrobiia bacterium]|jgi:metal-sulfur cluster biosynthetic enzyme|nr:iron-sulfur cluster assembly protein [Acidimicrobiia bacterium]